jgi:hypothetical protein
MKNQTKAELLFYFFKKSLTDHNNTSGLGAELVFRCGVEN